MKGTVPTLWAVCILGIILALIFGGAAAFLSSYGGWSDYSEQGTFFRELRKFDALVQETADLTAGRTPERLNARLDRLEKKAVGAETRLSVLKRRRNLAVADHARFQRPYREAAEQALAAFPVSGPLAALSADALLREYPDHLPAETQTTLRRHADLLPDPPLNSLALALSVLLGDLSDPAAAAALPRSGALLSLGMDLPGGAEREGFRINGILLSLLAKDRAAANAGIVSLLGSGEVSSRALRFGAEYWYDTNPLRAAELFSQFPGASSLGRLADSLWLAGYRDGAVELWTLLVSPPREGPSSGDGYGAVPPDLRIRSLYNLASVTTEESHKISYYRDLFQAAPGHVYGIIGYSRLFDRERAESILTEQDTGQALIDLELVRRRLEGWEIRRTVAETWLLLGRHPREEGLYRWGAWYFDRQRQFPETALLLRQARRQGIPDHALALHQGFLLIREGKLTEAETLLTEQAEHTTLWQIPANLGLLAESRRALPLALEYYQRAVSLTPDRSGEAKVRLRIARCLRMLGQAPAHGPAGTYCAAGEEGVYWSHTS
jgi:tetratricopeptide (TPR) repeat protein